MPLTSPRYPDSVFIFGDTVTEKFLAVGTCFAISSRHLLTVQHNLDPQNKSRLSGYAIAPYVSRDASGRIHIPKGFPRAVRILAYNTQMDYAIAELCKEPFDLVPIPISTEEVECDTNLKVYHCPVDIFNEEHVKDLTVFSACVKSARPTRHHVASNVGLYCGSSGGPFISQNGGAIGMHVESVNKANFVDIGAIGTNPIETKAEIVEAMEIISTTINSNAHAHASFSRGLVFSKCRKLLQYLRSLGII